MWFLLAACSQVQPTPSLPFDEVVGSVTDHLRATGDVTDRDLALTALAAARMEFEANLEPRLRETRDPLDVAAAEYGFARIHRAIVDGGDTRAEIDILVRRLNRAGPPSRVANR